jgi:hypothetical protein
LGGGITTKSDRDGTIVVTGGPYWDYMRNLWLVLFGGRRNERETKRGKGRRMMSREGVVCGGEKIE